MNELARPPRPEMRDLEPLPPAPLASVHLQGRDVAVAWPDGRRSLFHAVWLRDNCPCAACRHPQTLERRFLLLEAPEPAVAAATLLPGGHLEVRFAEGHVACFDGGWLRHYDYGAAARAERAARPRAWTAATLGRPAEASHAAVMESDAALQDWLATLLRDGLALLRAGPSDPGEVERVARRIGPPRATNFGLVFDVVSKPDPNNSAYTAMGLELHGDLPNWGWPPDFQFLYCLANEAQGGESVFADGLAVAAALRSADAGAYEILATTPVAFRFHDAADDIRHAAPVIETDLAGEPRSLRFNNWIRGALDVPAERVEPWYAAYRRFWGLLRDPAFRITLKLDAGEMAAFDNRRVLHGRTAFETAGGRRHLQGLYLDRDAVESRLRLLRRAA